MTRDLEIIFDTVRSSRKCQNLITNPAIAIVIGWDSETTIQYEGIAKIPNGDQLNSLLKIYINKFPDGIERNEKWEDFAYFYVKPRWIRYSDFGALQKIQELDFLE